MSAGDIKYMVEGWGEIMDAVSLYSYDPAHAKRTLARVMADPQNGVRAVAALFDALRAAIEHAHRMRAVKRLMLDYLAAQGLEGEPLEILREQAALDDAAAMRRKERDRETLEAAFFRGPKAYAETVRAIQQYRREDARRNARNGYRPPTMGAA